jgi:hypothetical protein
MMAFTARGATMADRLGFAVAFVLGVVAPLVAVLILLWLS